MKRRKLARSEKIFQSRHRRDVAADEYVNEVCRYVTKAIFCRITGEKLVLRRWRRRRRRRRHSSNKLSILLVSSFSIFILFPTFLSHVRSISSQFSYYAIVYVIHSFSLTWDIWTNEIFLFFWLQVSVHWLSFLNYCWSIAVFKRISLTLTFDSISHLFHRVCRVCVSFDRRIKRSR